MIRAQLTSRAAAATVKRMLRGIPVSPGIAVARAHCVDEVLAPRDPQRLDPSGLAAEVQRFDNACQAAALELDAIIERVSTQLGEAAAAIFSAHRLLLRDPALIGKVRAAIHDHRVDARSALHEVLDEYATLFNQIQDEYFKERLADVRDVVGRVMAQLALSESSAHSPHSDEAVILVAPEILPSQALLLKKFNVIGIITEAGGSTGHAAILARSMGIPSASGLHGILKQVKTGDLIILDGRDGSVYLTPDSELEAAYRKVQREYVNLRDKLVENRDQQAVMCDGTAIELLANANSLADAEMAVKTGAVGVGLYRTEYLFLTHPTVPSEEEQLAAYRAVIEAAPNRRVTIRTLDLGGDKLVPYFGHRREANPFMGWRSIRITSAYPEFFQTQLRAILRAGLHGEVRLLFPMISTLEEVLHIRRMLRRTQASLKSEGVAFRADIPVGAMLEVPAAALCINAILEQVDFVSIGSNDLTQYVMAADRDNPKVAHLCEPFSPPIFKLLHYAIRACNRRGKPVTLCGEMAGRPRCVLPLLGMGLRQLSMSPAFVPALKELVRSTDLALAAKTARKVLRLQTFREVRRYLSRVTRKICPNVAFLDTSK
jgi:phosphoenolpyruvate-protein phosphotransferase (PTS system enzyme I)